MSDDLAKFLRARLDEDEALARSAEGHPVFDGTGIVTGPAGAGFIRSDVASFLAWHGPGRTLREVAAKRAIVGRHRKTESETCAACRAGLAWPCRTLLDLAAIWSDHPDYRAEWKSDE